MLCVDRIFYKLLTGFKQVRFYANAVNDVTVPYATAGIDLEDIFLDHKLNGMKMCVLQLAVACTILILIRRMSAEN